MAGLSVRRSRRVVLTWYGMSEKLVTAHRESEQGLEMLAGASPAMRSLRMLIRRVARSDSTVLVLGESGTGKELVAQSIHRLSVRGRSPFVPVNCGAIPHELLESELFGHTKGSFTGALSDRRGRFEMADSGTLFLDEIGDMRLEMQVKLLRVLQERVVDRVGDERPRPVNVRIIAATHRELENAVTEGVFRADLYYRLNVIPLQVPPLREREDDVLLLFDHFARGCAGQGRLPVRAAPDLREWMLSHSWPGNCRELLNFVERLSVLWPGEEMSLSSIPPSMMPRRSDSPPSRSEEYRAVLDMWDLASEEGAEEPPASHPEPTAEPAASTEWRSMLSTSPNLPSANDRVTAVDLKKLLSEYEEAWIRASLRESLGNISHSADLLGLPRTTFIERLRKYGLSASRQ